MPVSRSSSRAWNRRLVTATRSRTRPPSGPDGSSSISSTAKPRSLSRRMRARIACRSSGESSGSRCSSSQTDVVARRGRSRRPRPRRRRRPRPALHRAEVGEPEGDVLDEDVEVVPALAVGQARVDLARLGVDEERLDLVAVAPEQRVRQRAVAPEHAGPVEVDEQPRHRVEQPVAVRPGPEREAHQQAAVLDREREVLGHRGSPSRAPATRRCRPPGPPAGRAPRGGGGRRTRVRPTRAAPP